MSIITLTTDFGLKDHAVATVKAALYSEIEKVNVVDVSHLISPFDTIEAAYVLKNVYDKFPQGTVHIIGVDAEQTPESKHIAVLLDGHYFICANNGIMSLIATEFKPDIIVEINIHKALETNYTATDVFVKVAAHISRGGRLEVIGKPILELKSAKNVLPIVKNQESKILGNVLYIDNYGNVITNITKQYFESIAKGRKYILSVRHVEFNVIYNGYAEAVNFDSLEHKREIKTKRIALFNSDGFLELAIYRSNPNKAGGASSLLGLDKMDVVTINFLP